MHVKGMPKMGYSAMLHVFYIALGVTIREVQGIPDLSVHAPTYAVEYQGYHINVFKDASVTSEPTFYYTPACFVFPNGTSVTAKNANPPSLTIKIGLWDEEYTRHIKSYLIQRTGIQHPDVRPMPFKWMRIDTIDNWQIGQIGTKWKSIANHPKVVSFRVRCLNPASCDQITESLVADSEYSASNIHLAFAYRFPNITKSTVRIHKDHLLASQTFRALNYRYPEASFVYIHKSDFDDLVQEVLQETLVTSLHHDEFVDDEQINRLLRDFAGELQHNITSTAQLTESMWNVTFWTDESHRPDVRAKDLEALFSSGKHWLKRIMRGDNVTSETGIPESSPTVAEAIAELRAGKGHVHWTGGDIVIKPFRLWGVALVNLRENTDFGTMSVWVTKRSADYVTAAHFVNTNIASEPRNGFVESGTGAPRGPPTAVGPAGPKGDSGQGGQPGAPGPVGIKGDRGIPGLEGRPGINGDRGHAGQPGKDGFKGDRGDPAGPGPMGIKGDRGITGQAGTPGVPGKDGFKGDRGDPGGPGPMGIKGDRGNPGQAGAPGVPGSHFNQTFERIFQMIGNLTDMIVQSRSFALEAKRITTWLMRDADTLWSLNHTVIAFTVQSTLDGVSAELTATTNSFGEMSLFLPKRNGLQLAVTFEVAGYYPITLRNVQLDVNSDAITTFMEPLLFIPRRFTGSGTATGTLWDFSNHAKLPGVKLDFRADMNSHAGTMVESITTSAECTWSVTLPAGHYTVTASKSGYITVPFTVVIVGGKSRLYSVKGLSPILNNGEIRIVSVGGDASRSFCLCAHVRGPIEGKPERAHTHPTTSIPGSLVRYAGCWYEFSSVLIEKQLAGIYRISVSDCYWNLIVKDRTGTLWDMANSGGTVQLYTGNKLWAQYFVPNRPGNAWSVVEINGTHLKTIHEVATVTSYNDVN